MYRYNEASDVLSQTVQFNLLWLTDMWMHGVM